METSVMMMMMMMMMVAVVMKFSKRVEEKESTR